MVEILLVATIAVICGAILNTVRGCLNSDEPYSVKKLVGSIIPAVFAGVAITQTLSTIGLGQIEVILLGLSLGFSVDYAVSKARK